MPSTNTYDTFPTTEDEEGTPLVPSSGAGGDKDDRDSKSRSRMMVTVGAAVLVVIGGFLFVANSFGAPPKTQLPVLQGARVGIKVEFPHKTQLSIEHVDKSDSHDAVQCNIYEDVYVSKKYPKPSIQLYAYEGIHHDYHEYNNWIECQFHVEFPDHPEQSGCSCNLKVYRYWYHGAGDRDRYGIVKEGCDCFGINAIRGEGTPKDGALVWPCQEDGCYIAPLVRLYVTPNWASCGWKKKGNGVCATPGDTCIEYDNPCDDGTPWYCLPSQHIDVCP